MAKPNEIDLKVDLGRWATLLAARHPGFSRADCERAALLLFREHEKDLMAGRGQLSVGFDSSNNPIDLEWIDVGELLKRDKEGK